MATITKQRAGQRSLRGLLIDSTYVTLGLGSAWVEFVRSVDRVRVETPRQARAIGKQAPKRLLGAADRRIGSVIHLVNQTVGTTRSLPDRATREFDELARRGRDLVGAIRGSTATRDAVERARIARSRVKAANTSIGRAAEGAVQAAERAATIVADRTEPAEHREIKVEPAAALGTRRRMPTPYEERTLEELQDRAKELGIEGRSSMSKDELITALRKQRTSSRRPAEAKPVQATQPTVDKAPQTGPYEERTLEELQDRAKEVGIEGRSSMSKDELITALREQR
jgi:hypothetical protein